MLTDTNELGNSRSFVYDTLGNLTERTDRNGKVREFDYDLLSRLTEERWVDGATVVNTLDYNYDAASQLLDAGDNNSAYAFTYDQLGRRTSTDNFGTPGVPNVVLSSGYDALGNRTSLSATIDGAADFENSYTYDALSRRTSVQQRGIGSLPVTDKRVDFSYNALGQFTGIDRYEDLTATDLVASSTYAYDTAGRLTNLDHLGAVAGAPDPATLAFYSWTYDSANRLTEVSSIDGTTDYSYDSTGQLIGATYEAGAGLPTAPPDEIYSYDENGNRTMAGYVIGANNLVLSDGTYNYEYDAENNLTKKTETATGDYIQYAWDIGGRLTSVEYRDSSDVLTKRVEYTYDVFNRKIGKQVDDNGDGTFDRAERYVYDDSGKFDTATGVPLDDIVLVFDDSGSLTNRYLHGPAIDQVLADEQLTGSIIDEVLWSLPDHLGTVRDWAAYDAALAETTVANHLTYDSFGNITSQTDPSSTPLYAFTGREWDPDAELYYYRARWFDPNSGRFVSDDPTGFMAGDANVQRYVENSPTNATDPSGLERNAWQRFLDGFRRLGNSGPRIARQFSDAGDSLAGAPDRYRKGFGQLFPWKAAFADGLPHRLIDRYQSGTGRPYTLSRDEMVEVQPKSLSLEGSDEFMETVESMRREGTMGQEIECTRLSVAQNPGTLGWFTVRYRGTVTIGSDALWRFDGEIQFEDRYDFDQSSHRGEEVEAQVTFARMFMKGRGFRVTSPSVPYSQEQAGLPGWHGPTKGKTPELPWSRPLFVAPGKEYGGFKDP